MRGLRVLLQRLAIFVAPTVGAWLIRLIGVTARRIIGGFEGIKHKGRTEMRSAIYVFWHDQLLCMSSFFASRVTRLAILVSHHRDGEIIARVVKSLGLDVIRGSSTRGGAAALVELASYLRDGGSVVLTPDGPRGPRHRASEGVVLLAQRLGKPLIPVACAARPVWRAGSWDRLQVPMPFAKVAGLEGKPIVVPKGADRARREHFRRELERLLEELLGKAESEIEGGRSG